ncbi:MAG TPA: hypothetical protein VMV74_09715 [Bacteroidales bacterium]|nr:hypothetical protein [Bacteroidales bacterium]
MKMRSYIFFAALLLPFAAFGQTTQDETIKRSVTLYNPYKPTLQEATKRAILPAVDDTSRVRVDFKYTFTPGTFTPEYKVAPIKSASLSPEPLPDLKKGYVSLGLGTWLSPFLEVSVSNGRSRKGVLGIYTRSYASAGKISLADANRVFAGFMDNQAIVYGKKYFRRSRFDTNIDIKQMSRYAYGYDPDVTGYDPSRKDIRSLYYDVTGTARYFTMEPDSSDLNWDATVKYNLFSRGGVGFQHNPGFSVKGEKNMFGFYGGADIDYDLYLFSDKIDSKARNLFSLSPYITRGNDEWRFRFGFTVAADIRENIEPLSGGALKAYIYFFPDVSFTFRVIPSFLRFTAAIDGSLDNNQAKNTAYINPWIMPGDTLFTLRNTDNKLRLTAGVAGNLNVSATYAFDVSYTIFNDMLLFMNDTVGVGNYFLPVYDNGDLFKIHGETVYPFNRQITLSFLGNYYRYSMSGQEHAWHKPAWNVTLKGDYNLRNKIIASASLTVLGERYAMIRAPESSVILPVHPNLNLGVEYRYTPALSFWVKANNISYNRYYEWNYYPAQNFMILGGFTYSL